MGLEIQQYAIVLSYIPRAFLQILCIINWDFIIFRSHQNSIHTINNLLIITVYIHHVIICKKIETLQNLDPFRLLWHCTEGNDCLERTDLLLTTLPVSARSIQKLLCVPFSPGPANFAALSSQVHHSLDKARHPLHIQIQEALTQPDSLLPILMCPWCDPGSLVYIWSSRVSEVPGVPTRGKVRLERRGRRKIGTEEDDKKVPQVICTPVLALSPGSKSSVRWPGSPVTVLRCRATVELCSLLNGTEVQPLCGMWDIQFGRSGPRLLLPSFSDT